MAGFYDVTNHPKERVVQYRVINSPADAVGTAVFLSDAAEAKLPTAAAVLPYADLVTYDPALVNATYYVIPYDAGKGPLYISAQPANATPTGGTDATFTLTAAGGEDGATRAYIWYKNGVPIQGATTATLTIAKATQKDNGNYWCVVKSAVVGTGRHEEVTSNVVTLTATPSLITAVGQTQFSADGVTWGDTIPDGVMVAGSPVDFYIRTNPDELVAPDGGDYVFIFMMGTTGAGGLSLRNDMRNRARITGTTPADQSGLTFSVNCTVKDSAGTSVAGTALEKDWE